MLPIITSDSRDVERLVDKITSEQVDIENRVRGIIEQVKLDGDKAVLTYTRMFDGADIGPDNFRVTVEEINAACRQVEPEYMQAIEAARRNIEAFHLKQLRTSWMEPDSDGTVLGQLYRPLERIGAYVPGGTAAYPSSVLMNAVPARVAGVSEIVIVTPPGKDGSVNPYTLAAAAAAGVDEIYKMGGAQAIAALAYGTETVRKVDKISGPGNIYVTLAKKLVYGQVDIDMLAGPSEILVIADEEANPAYVAADLLSQAEHDPMASAILLTPCPELAAKVREETLRQLTGLSRKNIIEASLADFSAIIVTRDLEEAFALANKFAPEHLELYVADPFTRLGQIKNAGAIFLGGYSPEPIGDYMAGPNHILPTGGTARFYSPLGVDTFLKRSSVIAYSRQSLSKIAAAAIKLAEVEGLDAHANAVKVRLGSE